MDFGRYRIEDGRLAHWNDGYFFGDDTSLSKLIHTGQFGDDDILKHLEMLEEYDITTGIKDHLAADNDDLWTVMETHPEEDPVTGSRALLLIDELIVLKVPELTHTSLPDLLRFPLHVLTHLIQRCRDAANKAKSLPLDLK